MALPLAKAAPLKPEIKLAQALSEFEAVLPNDTKTKLRAYRGQSPPNSTDVVRFTAEIDRDASRNRKSRQCVGTRLTSVLNAVQQFSTVADIIVGSSQSQIACAIWGTVKISLQLASAISSYFDQLSKLFMRIGLTSLRYQDFGLLYLDSTRLRSALCEYFVVIVRLCKQAVLFLQKPFWSQLSSSMLKPFESEFGSFQQDLETLAGTIREEILLASNLSQQNEIKEMSRFRAFAKNFSDTSTREIGEARTWKRKAALLQFLDACSVYDYEKSWKQARKQGNTNWICHDEGYKQWKQEKVSSTLWCTGILGSGKTVLSANVVEDLKITTPAAVAYFFCRYDEAESLEARTIIGSIARQILDHTKSDIVDRVAEIRPHTIGTDRILDYLQELLPSNSHKYFIIIDGLDECKEKESKQLLECLNQLLVSKHVFQVYCSSRPDVSRWACSLLKPQWNVSMSQTSADIEEYVEDTLVQHLESGSLSIGDSTLILTIQNTLLEHAHGMFLWVAFQIDSICSQKTDEAILAALEDLPKDLPHTFNRILRNLQHSNADDPQFGRKIFDLVAAAQRPLTLEELREAISVKPGEKSWDTSKMVNDMFRSLLESCGSLVIVDEERLTIHFAHQSVKQHLLSGPMDLDMKKYHISMKEADLCMGNIIVTYLNFGIFDRELAKANSTISPQVELYPSAILSGSLPRSNIARLAVRLLRGRGNSRIDIHSQLKAAAGIVGEPKERTQPAHAFLPYAQEYWLFHTKELKPARLLGDHLWQSLIDGADINAVSKEHGTALHAALEVGHEEIARLLLKSGADANAETQSRSTVLQAASYHGREEMARLLLENGADVNAVSGKYGTALQAASTEGYEEIAKLLLENGANANAKGGFYASALQAASFHGHEGIAKLLLKHGANVNAQSGEYYGTALRAASFGGHVEIARILLENGADSNAVSADNGTALHAALMEGHEEMARLLLENGADINVQGGYHGTALQGACVLGNEKMARFLLANGADVNAASGNYGTALQAALRSGNREIVGLLLDNGAIPVDWSIVPVDLARLRPVS